MPAQMFDNQTPPAIVDLTFVHGFEMEVRQPLPLWHGLWLPTAGGSSDIHNTQSASASMGRGKAINQPYLGVDALAVRNLPHLQRPIHHSA